MQPDLFESITTSRENGRLPKAAFADPNFAVNKSLPVHRWVPWIAGFSSDFVRDVIHRELDGGRGVVLDPFAGVGTTLVEAGFMGHDLIGFEINPYAALACRVKLEAVRTDSTALRREIRRLRAFCGERVENGYVPVTAPPEGFRTRHAFFSEAVLRKVLILQDFVEEIADERVRDLFRIAFAATMVSFSNYSYEPSLGTRKAAGKEDVHDADVAALVAGKLAEMAEDVDQIRAGKRASESAARIYECSFFTCPEVTEPGIADLAITSPPYLNNYHYVRNTRPHLYWLGFAAAPQDTRPLEERNFGKFWQTVRDQEDVPLDFADPPEDLVKQLEELRTLHPEKGVYGGNGWANYAASYFNDCYRFARGLVHALKPGGTAYVVIGNSILQGRMIPTDVYLGRIAEAAGLTFADVQIPRAERVGNSIIQSNVRASSARTSDSLYEAVVVLRKP